MESGIHLVPRGAAFDLSGLQRALHNDPRVAPHPDISDAFIVADHPATAARVREAFAQKQATGYGGAALLRVSPGGITAYLDMATSEALEVMESLLTPIIVAQAPRLVNTDWDADVSEKYRDNISGLFR